VIGRVAGVLQRLPLLGHSHAAYMIIRGIESVAKSKDQTSSKKKTTLNSLFSLPPDVVKDPEKSFQVQLGLYQKYERDIEAIAREYGIKTAYFMQPVPGWGKELSEKEKQAAGDLSYVPRYRRVVEGMLTLRERGLPVFDLGDIYKDHKETLYADQIHCFRKSEKIDNYRADSPCYSIMAEAIAKRLAETWGFKEKPAN
jgi:hypothetical protein